MTMHRKLMGSVVLAFVAAVSLNAQNPGYLNQNNETGTPGYGSYAVSGIDSVNLANGGVSVKLPLVSRKMRSFDISVGYRYDSKFWNVYRYPSGTDGGFGEVQNVWRIDAESGWQLTDPFAVGLTYNNSFIVCPPHVAGRDADGNPIVVFPSAALTVSSGFLITRGDGTRYRFPNRKAIELDYPEKGSCPDFWNVLNANIIEGHSDSGHFKLDIADLQNTVGALPNFKLFWNDGTFDNHVGTAATQDTNGNVYPAKDEDLEGWRLDNIGRRLYKWQSDPNNQQLSTNQLNYIDDSGAVQAIQIEYGNISIFPTFPTTAYFTQPSGPGPFRVLKKITLPNGRAYIFSYENPDQPGSDNPFGELTKITLPTGGYVRYKYATIAQRDFLEPLALPYIADGNYDHLDSRVLVERAESADGVTEHVWHYSYTYDFSGNSATTTVTDPEGNQEIHYFSFVTPDKPLETRVERYEGATLIRITVNDWATDYGPLSSGTPVLGDFSELPKEVGIRNARIIRSTTTLNDSGQASKVESDYNDCFSYSDGTTYTDCRDNITEKREFDYNATVPTRVTRYTYLHQQSAAYNTAHIWNRLADQKVYQNSTTNLKAETAYSYDTTSLIPTSGVLNHNAVSGLRGNQTEVKSWKNTDNAWITTTTAYDDLGNVRSTTDPLGHTTNFYYDDAWANSACALPANSNAYLTKVVNPLGHELRTTYYPCSGHIAAQADQNDINAGRQGGTYTYDYMGRLTLRTLPDGGQSGFAYAETGPVMVTTTVKQDPTHEIVSTTTLDGFGRIRRTSLDSDPVGSVLIDTSYDSMGRVSSVTNPYRSTADPTYGVTTTVYDALGRVGSVTKQDGSIVRTQYLGNAVTVTDEAGKQRRTYFDALGRLVRVDEPRPEGQIIQPGAPGTGWVAVNGSLQTSQNQTQTAAPGIGSVTISGSLQSKQIQTNCREEYVWNGDDWVSVNVCDSETLDDGGTVWITLSGNYTKGVPYGSNGGGSTPSAIAIQLAQAINADTSFPVSAQVSGAVITLTARLSGAATNYTLASSSSTVYPEDFVPSFTATRSGPNLTGGHDAAYSTITDAGSVSISVGSTTKSITYGQGDTASSVASRLATAFNSDPAAVVNVSLSGTTLSFQSKITGTSANYSLTFSSTTSRSQYFSQPSFTTSGSGNALTGGQDQITGGGFNYPYVTLYTNDALNNLTCVEQHGDSSSGTGCSADPVSDSTSAWRVRRFAYNSLGQLFTAKNPESGTINYSYDGDGNVLTKISPAPNQTGSSTLTITYGYDALHRLTAKTYSNGGPAVSYLYDQATYNGLTITNGIGRRTGMSDASGQTAWSYDSMGRAQVEKRTVAGVTKQLSYTYNLDGSPAALTYPSGNTISFGYDLAGHLVSAKDTANNINYAQGATYTAPGQLSGLTLGYTSGFNGYTLANSYNPRLQPTLLSAQAPAGTIMSRFYSYGPNQQNNGNIGGITNNLVADRSAVFTYDQLNRIASAQSTGTDCSTASGTSLSRNWGNSYSIDPWGNLYAKNVTKCSSETLSTTVNLKNQLNVGAHDAAGNLLNYGSATYTYDPENRIISTAGATYVYDGDGVRVKKSGGAAPATLYWGESFTAGPVTETDLAGTIKAEYVYFGGKRIARRDYPSGAVHYYFSDHLNSTNLVYSATGALEEDSDFYPYGTERGYVIRANHFKFTGKERDSESGLDYFGARYYGSPLGRFLTPDWADKPTAVPYAEFGDPQSLNLYGYVRNNPLSRPDTDGHCPDGCPDPADTPKTLAEIDRQNQANKDFLIGFAKGAANLTTSAMNVFITMGQSTSGPIPQLKASNDIQAVGMVFAGAVGMVPGNAPAAPLPSLSERANAIHGALDPIAQQMRTTAIGEAVNGERVVATSSRTTLSPGQRAVLQPGETAAKGASNVHAEAKIMNSRPDVKSIATTRQPCGTCKAQAAETGVKLEQATPNKP